MAKSPTPIPAPPVKIHRGAPGSAPARQRRRRKKVNPFVLFLRGQTKTGVGLVVLYGAAALSRQALEPRLVGKQVGLNPVLTLLALYTGYRLLGVGGMIVFPITAMLLKQIWDHSGLQPEG